MPSTSPGSIPTTSSSFEQILPGAPTTSLQSLNTFTFRQKRYIAYISGRQVNLLSSPAVLVQALTFEENLVSITAEPRTGKVVVAGKKDVWVLEPHTEGWTRVWWQRALSLVREDAGDEARWVSWGGEGELLVGGTRQLSLFNTLPSSRTTSPASREGVGNAMVERRKGLWSIAVANPVQYSCFSPSGGMIATCGRYDRLVKIWRRLSYEEGLFDYTYLPHPGVVTHLEWRPFGHSLEEHLEDEMAGRHDEEDEVLFTLATDGILRVWVTGNAHDLDILVLHTSIDLNGAIPESPSLAMKSNAVEKNARQPARYAFIVPSDQFCAAVSALMPLGSQEKLSHSLEHLKEISSKDPDVIITLDGRGRMSAWGLQSVGHKRRPETPSGHSKQGFHISHAEQLPLQLPEGINVRFQSWLEAGKFNALAHAFSGYIQWWRGDVQTLFSPSATGSEHLEEVSYWSGHAHAPITNLVGASDGRCFASSSDSGETALWKPSKDGVIHNTSIFTNQDKFAILQMLPGSENHYILLEQSQTNEWELRLAIRDCEGKVLDSKLYEIELGDGGSDWQLFLPPVEGNLEYDSIRVAALCNSGKGLTLSIAGKHMSEITCITIPTADDENDELHPIHSSAVLAATETNRVGLVSVTKTGSLLLHHLDLSDRNSAEPVTMATFESGVQNASLLAVRNEFAALVSTDGRSLVIVDLREGYVDHRQALGGQIRRIVPARKDSSIAVVYDEFVQILTQGRYEQFGEMPPWILVKTVSMASIGLGIAAVAWLGDGSLAIAAGNGIFVASDEVSVEELHPQVKEAIDADLKPEKSYKLSSLSRQLKTPLPVWHPSVVAHTVRHGHWSLGTNILTRLARKLKFWSEGEELHPHLEMSSKQLYDPQSNLEASILDESLTNDLMQQLDEKDLPEVSLTEQERLKRVLQAMAYCSQHVNGLDNAALRFLFSWKLQTLSEEDRQMPNGTGPNGPAKSHVVPEMHWREIAFIYHSSSQQPLLDILIAHYDNKITWHIARRLGLFAWLSDREALDRIFDALAQSAYRSTDPPDPINASLYFLALHKKATLLALWRIATWHKEQKSTMNFLRRDFAQPQNQTAAKKNAYALMGKKRFDYAAAFFLLADDATSATSLLASQCEDIMLAIAVARLYSGDGSPVLRKLVEGRLMPQARTQNNRWLMSWCHAILFEKDSAAEALVQPLDGVRTWQQDDPNTLTLYAQLRKQPSEFEYEAVLRAARILRRMGLWLLALELVSQWQFKHSMPTAAAGMMQEAVANGVHPNITAITDIGTGPAPEEEPPSMLDGSISLPVAASAEQDEKTAREAKAAELLKKLKEKKTPTATPVVNEKEPEPTQFKEPDANSLLDSFGF